MPTAGAATTGSNLVSLSSNRLTSRRGTPGATAGGQPSEAASVRSNLVACSTVSVVARATAAPPRPPLSGASS
eukprot:1482868-Prymnesium_polylepis.1